jgi:hypothetical protein
VCQQLLVLTTMISQVFLYNLPCLYVVALHACVLADCRWLAVCCQTRSYNTPTTHALMQPTLDNGEHQQAQACCTSSTGLCST